MHSPRLHERPHRLGLGRTLALLLASCGLSACVAQQGGPGYGRTAGYLQQQAPATPTGRRVALLLPLSGVNAQLGQSMLLAAKLAFEPGGPNAFDTQDTRGTPDGAATAMRAAINAGAGIVVGPLTAGETAAVAPVATARAVAVLALTSDATKAQPGIWPLGLTPGQQVRTLVRAAAADYKRRIGAILPSNPFGDSLAAELVPAAAEAGLPPPLIMRFQGQSGLDAAVARMGTPSDAPGSSPGNPLAIDALLLGTAADTTIKILPDLIRLGMGPDRIRILGTALWARDAAKLAPLAGAWFAGPPAETLKVFSDNYISHYGTAPRDVASVAFDAAAAAHAVTGPNGVDVSVLLNPSGFAGANGVFRLLPDGQVRRSLALFEIGSTGVQSRPTPQM